ncbi:MAG: S8 family serine peptidase, partial [Fretibacterium sp.]|nr:S8 family serine peptidase [Fretibacterium sp.]
MRRYPGFFCTCLLVFLCIGVADAGSTVPGEAIVLFRNVEGTRLTRASSLHGSVQYRLAAAAAASGARVVGTYGALSEAVNDVFALIRSENRTTEQLMESLRSNPNVLAISPNRPVYATDSLSGDEKVPNDSSFSRLWGMAAIDAPRSWIETTGDASVHVAVLDTGVAAGHEDLKDNVDTSRSRNFTPLHNSYEDDAGHGTHVSGVIGAVGNNGVGVAGVNWTTRIISFKVLNSFGSGSTATIMKALDGLLALLNDEPDLKVAAVNLSLGGYDFESPEEAMAHSAEWRAYKALDDTNRILIVVAAGN